MALKYDAANCTTFSLSHDPAVELYVEIVFQTVDDVACIASIVIITSKVKVAYFKNLGFSHLRCRQL